MRVLMTAEDMITAFEVVRVALENQRIYDEIALELDISDEELSRVYQRIMGFLDPDQERA